MIESLKEVLKRHNAVLATANDLDHRAYAAKQEKTAAEQKLAEIEVALEAAEQAHAEALALQQLGEIEDVSGTAAALDDARKTHADTAPDLRQSVRVATAVAANLAAKLEPAVAALRAVEAELKNAQNDEIADRLTAAVSDTAIMVENLAEANIKIVAMHQLLNDRGAQYQGPDGARLDRVMHPDHNAVVQHRTDLLAEFARMTAA